MLFLMRLILGSMEQLESYEAMEILASRYLCI